MRLAGIHRLLVVDTPFLRTISEEEVEGGYRKNENTPVAKAYHSSGMSQDEIARKAKVHPSTISRYKSKERNVKRRPSFDTLKRLSSVVGARVNSMFPELG